MKATVKLSSKTLLFSGLLTAFGIIGAVLLLRADRVQAQVAQADAKRTTSSYAPYAPHVFYVSVTGNDANPGTKAKPWATLQRTVDRVPAGSVIYLRGGTYHQRITIQNKSDGKHGYLVIESAPGEHAVLDGTGVSNPDGGLVTIQDSAYIRVSNLEIRNWSTRDDSLTPMGILIVGRGSHIQITNNHIHEIRTLTNSQNGNAHGIAVYGNETSPISDLTISGNTLDHLQLGASESLALNGNVTNFSVSANVIHDTNNIGIDIIGFEGTAPTPGLDRARNGIVENNTVYRISSYGNPAYGNQFAADGIYVDGGTHVLVQANRVFADDYGIELASEHANGSTTNVILKNNVIYNNRAAGIALGGYDTQRGYTANCTIEHNTLYHNDLLNQGFGQIYFAYDTRSNVIMWNIFDGGSNAVLVANPFLKNTQNHMDNNVFFTTVGQTNSEFEWRNTSYTGLTAYRTGSGNDRNSLFAQPSYENTQAGHFNQRPNSATFPYGSALN